MFGVQDNDKHHVKSNKGIQNFRKFIERKLTEIACDSNSFNDVPPIIGILIADQYGNTIMVLEHDSKDEKNYGPIKSYLVEDDKNLLEIDLISMYFSSLKIFAGQTNIQNLTHLEIDGSNIKVQIYFLLEKFMVIIFLNSHTDLNFKEKTQIIKYFEDKLIKYKYEFMNFNSTDSKKKFRILENNGRYWLKKINSNYIVNYKNEYIKKHEQIEILMNELTPIIQNELFGYLEHIPDNIVNDLSKEIKNKIQDKLLEFNPYIFKKNL